jgi:hypothetical protein
LNILLKEYCRPWVIDWNSCELAAILIALAESRVDAFERI